MKITFAYFCGMVKQSQKDKRGHKSIVTPRARDKIGFCGKL